MDSRKIIELLRATIDPNQRIQAEEQLLQVSFCDVLGKNMWFLNEKAWLRAKKRNRQYALYNSSILISTKTLKKFQNNSKGHVLELYHNDYGKCFLNIFVALRISIVNRFVFL